MLLDSAASVVNNSPMDPNADTGKGLSLQVHKWAKTKRKKMFIHTFETEAQLYQALLPRMHLPVSHNALRLIIMDSSYGG